MFPMTGFRAKAVLPSLAFALLADKGFSAMFALGFGLTGRIHAFLGAISAPFRVGFFDLELPIARWASERDALLEMRLRAGKVRAWNAFSSDGKPLRITLARAEMMFGFSNICGLFAGGLAALLAGHFDLADANGMIAKILRPLTTLREAFSRTVYTGQASVIPKRFTAIGTFCLNSRSPGMALTGTVAGVSPFINPTIFTCVHRFATYINSVNVAQKRSNGYGWV
jgi:hypothetical protein